jgi:transposase
LAVLGIDELALKRGQRDYAVMISTWLEDGQIVILGILPNREKATVEAFLNSIPEALKATVHSVCMDMYEAYRSAVKAALPHAQSVIDRFHVVQKYAEEADQVRRQEMARLKKTLPKTEYRDLKAARRAFRKHPARLDPDEKAALQRLFQHAPSLRLVYAFREGLFTIFQTATSKADAQEQLRIWMFLVREQAIPGFDAFLKTLLSFWDEITNFFVLRLTSGFVEGLNNKIRVLLRRAYGLFNLTHLFQRLSLDLEGYPSCT